MHAFLLEFQLAFHLHLKEVIWQMEDGLEKSFGIWSSFKTIEFFQDCLPSDFFQDQIPNNFFQDHWLQDHLWNKTTDIF